MPVPSPALFREHGDAGVTASRPLKLVFVATLPEPGGAASHLISLARALGSAGHAITVMATPESVIWTGLAGAPGVRLVAGTFTRALDPMASDTLAATLAVERPDHVLAVFEQDYWGTLQVSRRYRIPASLFLHHAGMRRTNRMLLPFTRPRFVVPSEDLRRWIVSRRVAEQRTRVLHNPIDTQHFRPDAALRADMRAALGFSDEDVVIGFVGRFEANKGVLPFADAMTQAMAASPAIKALWVGFGRREGDMDSIIQQSPYAHRHVRRPWTSDVRPYYCAMDLLALPSTGRESFGRVLVEAQACAIPVLGSHIGGIPETMQVGGSGDLIPPGDVAAWTQAMVALASAPHRRADMGQTGRRFVEHRFDSRVIAREFEQLVPHFAT